MKIRISISGGGAGSVAFPVSVSFICVSCGYALVELKDGTYKHPTHISRIFRKNTPIVCPFIGKRVQNPLIMEANELD